MLGESILLGLGIPAATLAGAGISLWVQKTARGVADERLKETLKGALAEFKLELLGTMNGTYVRSGLCDERHERK